MIRQPSVAGQFYPARPETLKSEIEGYLKEVSPLHIEGKIHGIVAPHAGYVFSGLRAAAAYKALSGKSVRNAVVISPSHREYFDYLSIYPGEGYETPLGEIPRTTDFDSLIESSTGCRLSEAGHRYEHALEVQLPFLQVVLKDSFNLLPVVMGNQDEKIISALSQFLKDLKDQDPDALIVASSDLSHFHTAASAQKMDSDWIRAMKAFDVNQLKKLFLSQACEACGGGCIIGLMSALSDEKNRIKVTGYSHSGEVNHDESSVVGYTSAVIWEE